MSKTFIIVLVIIGLGFGALVFTNRDNTPSGPLLGTQHADQGQNHIPIGQSHAPYNSDPASSGPHRNDSGAPTLWGVYTEEVPEEAFVHNEEHGGVVITYNPKLLPADQLKKLQALFAPPYSNKGFTPSKAVVTPRAKDTHAIEVASWRYTFNLDQYDEATLIKYYNQHEGKSPEPAAGPSNTPINQAGN